jgi:type VI secretion system (T6SS) phospholipase Tle1-like effector
MTKTWIVCIDGTRNQPGQKDKDPVTAQEEAAPSNVVRTWEALANILLAGEFYYGSIAPIQPKILFTGVQGEVIYLAGIGTSGTVETHVLEGATGTGTSERIRDAYRYLAERYRPGDRIYGFGFSRGAFAIRSLIGLIDLAGLPKEPRALKEEELLQIYDAYMAGKLVDKARYGTIDTMIDFLGLWDTVGALAFGRTLGNFHRINPGNVKRVAHAWRSMRNGNVSSRRFGILPQWRQPRLTKYGLAAAIPISAAVIVMRIFRTSHSSGFSNRHAMPDYRSMHAAFQDSI